MSQILNATTLRAWATLGLGRLGSVASAAALLALAGRSLPEGELAVFVLHVATFGFAGLFATTGTMPLLLRELGRGAQGMGAPVARAIVARAWRRSAVAALGFVVAVFAFGHGDDALLLACAAAVALQPLHLWAAPILLAGRVAPLARSEAAGRAVALALAVLASAAEVSSAGAYLLAIALGQGAAGVWLRVRRGAPALVPVAPAAGPPPRGGPRADHTIALGDLARAGYLHASQWILAALAGAAYVGFGAPLRLFVLLALLPATLSLVLAGKYAAASVDLGALRRTIAAVVAAGVVVALGLALAAPLGIAMFFPDLAGDPASTTCLRVLGLAVPAMFGSSLILPFLLARAADRRVLLVSCAGLATAIVVLLAAYPSAGVVAGALSLAAAEWCVFALAAHALAIHGAVAREGA